MNKQIKVKKKMNKIKQITTGLMMLSASTLGFAAGADDPLLYKVMIDKIEINDDNPSPLVFEGNMWIGRDLNKFWLKSEIETVGGVVEENIQQFLYSKALYPFWDLQMGVKIDNAPTYQTTGLAVAMYGLAPYLFEVDASLFLEDTGQITASLEAEYEYMITQRFIISPEFAANINTKDDAVTGKSAGLANTSFGIRARYEIKREFAPYIGVLWKETYGTTADNRIIAGEPTGSFNIVAGVRAWF